MLKTILYRDDKFSQKLAPIFCHCHDYDIYDNTDLKQQCVTFTHVPGGTKSGTFRFHSLYCNITHIRKANVIRRQ